ncbi:acetyl-coenzyme A synthetase N-terminal domain-containing protein, partial [Xenorhabdus bovienii]
ARRIYWQQPFDQVLDHSNPPFARWFCGGKTNLCYNALDRWLESQPDSKALIAISTETNSEKVFTYKELHQEVNRAAAIMLS